MPKAALLLIIFLSASAHAQQDPSPHEHHAAEPQAAPQHDHGGAELNEAGSFLMSQASGTGVAPSSSTLPMFMRTAGDWNLMFHGSLFLTAVQQTGPRGGDKFFSTNWAMGAAERRLGRGSLAGRAMLSLDPLTVTHRRYPQLFQTGETAFGEPVIDGQHPHDLVMELSLQYARSLGESSLLHLYYAPIGDPALGPVSFPHRVSAAALPQATLGHHLQDSTHIASQVATVGFAAGPLRIEASGFHGTEPDENRWNIDYGPMNSWSGRLWLLPHRDWSAQLSLGRLKEPEALEEGDIVRATASLSYNRPLADGYWASSLIWGRNHKTADGRNLNSYLAESVVQFRRKNYLTGRVELVDKDELFGHAGTEEEGEDDHDLEHGVAGRVFRIAAYTLGYSHVIAATGGLEAALGGNFTLYSKPRDLDHFYGRTPAAFVFSFRLTAGER